MSDGKPDLLRVLEHYQAQVQPHRTSQLIQCPVHDEDRASCSVNLAKGLMNCMACGFSGDVYSLVMAREKVGFGAARERAATIAGEPSPVPARGGRSGLRGEPGTGRGGYRPKARRGFRKP